jgi:hypothetical protein
MTELLRKTHDRIMSPERRAGNRPGHLPEPFDQAG